MLLFLVYVLLGIVVGILSGLFGIGGGTIIVPVLVFTFTKQHINSEILTHLALGTSLSTIVFTSISSVYTHNQKQAINWFLVKFITIGILIGAIVGVNIAVWLSSDMLQKIIGSFCIIVAINMFLNFDFIGKKQDNTPSLLISSGVVIGALSSIFGIGGGAVTVPLLTLRGLTFPHAVATSSACGISIAVCSSIGYVYKGFNNILLPDYSLGFVYMPAVFGISITSVIFAKFGALIAHKLDGKLLKKLFALLLIIVGLYFIF